MEQTTECQKAEEEIVEVPDAEMTAKEGTGLEEKEQEAEPQAEAELQEEADNIAATAAEADAAAVAGEETDKAESKLQEVAEKLASLEKLFEARISYTTFEEQSRVNMHKELQKYKEGMYGRIMQPLLMDIIGLREDMLKTIAGCEKRAPEEQAIPLADFSAYANQDLTWLLEKYDVNSYQSEAGSEFSAHRHKTAKTVLTEEEGKHGKIAYSLSNGYEYNGRVIYLERVARYVYKKPQTELTEEEK